MTINISPDKFLRTAGYTLFDHKRYEAILEELKVKQVDEKLRKSNWLRHVTKMDSNSMTTLTL
jgi:hypothetical protein